MGIDFVLVGERKDDGTYILRKYYDLDILREEWQPTSSPVFVPKHKYILNVVAHSVLSTGGTLDVPKHTLFNLHRGWEVRFDNLVLDKLDPPLKDGNEIS